MFYKLLGMLTWKGVRWFLRRRYGAPTVRKPLLAGGVVVLLLGVAFAARQRGGES